MIRKPNRKKDGKVLWGIIVFFLFIFATVSGKFNYVEVFILIILIKIRYDILDMFWTEDESDIFGESKEY